jgi:hypothetical protein
MQDTKQLRKPTKKQLLLKMMKDRGITPEMQRESLKELQEFVKSNPLTPLDEVRRNAWR